jgi:fermentation-respiration switch protein FrsA (DUF1100 family)
MRVVLLLVALYVLLAVMLALLQRTLIYHPLRAATIQPEDLEWPRGQVHTIELRTHDGLVLRGWHILPDGQQAQNANECDRALQSGQPLVIYFPGNAGHRAYRGEEIAVFTRQGAQVFLFDYRGYGDNPGSPSEALLARDAASIWDYATRERKVPAERIVVYGESLGGGIAVRLAAERCAAGDRPAALVLRSTFCSLVAVASYHFPWLPVRWGLVDRFSSLDRIGQVSCPLLQIHGQADTIVPFEFARRLFAAAPARSRQGIEKQLLVIPEADHNDLIFVAASQVERAIAELLRRL